MTLPPLNVPAWEKSRLPKEFTLCSSNTRKEHLCLPMSVWRSESNIDMVAKSSDGFHLDQSPLPTFCNCFYFSDQWSLAGSLPCCLIFYHPVPSVQTKVRFSSCLTLFPIAVIHSWLNSLLTTFTIVCLDLSLTDLERWHHSGFYSTQYNYGNHFYFFEGKPFVTNVITGSQLAIKKMHRT